MNISTPALLFSATSLILLAFTNRFLTIATIVRSLKNVYDEKENYEIKLQIKNLRQRLILIKNMQLSGVLSLFFSVLSMTLLFYNIKTLGEIFFGISLLLMLISLALSFWEISISVKALELHLSDLEKKSE